MPYQPAEKPAADPYLADAGNPVIATMKAIENWKNQYEKRELKMKRKSGQSDNLVMFTGEDDLNSQLQRR
jgi:hypothetical protein